APIHHPIATSVPEAQKFFDQGLSLVYAFNHEEAIRSFERAAELDPKAPMPLWGIALASGSNINDPEPAAARLKRAREMVDRAQALAAQAPETPAVERDYLAALGSRYSADPQADRPGLARDYNAAMRELSKKYPDDPDAATLFAESGMDLKPWRLWNGDGTPAEGTLEIVATLEAVLKRDPQHPGANHYYIHAVEASPDPRRALPSAQVLATLAPAAGHLVHMPAHIQMRTGSYAAAARSNALAAEADREYIRQTGAQGMYPAMYYNHNLHFLASAWSMAGNWAEAKKAADQLGASATPLLAEMPMVEAFLTMPSFVNLRFQKWSEVVRQPDPGAKLPILKAIWHYGRVLALVSARDTRRAEAEKKLYEAARERVAADAFYGNNSPKDVLELASAVLDARLAWLSGDRPAATEIWRKAVSLQDALFYDEPPPWYYPVRESLGAALLRQGQAGEAEEVFRQDLARNPRSGRSLFGLLESLKAQKKTAGAAWVERELAAAWKDADIKLRIEDY
ncbi:MAG: tetratricopeptide repeat protein, partial [Thermoanaerobaculia bacterium]